jgi:hypothetical protein
LLGGREGGEYARWLREIVGALKPVDTELIEAIASLRALIATTNYDSLLEAVTGLRAVTWDETSRLQRAARQDEEAILHLHGYWERPTTVVLGMPSYEAVLGDGPAQVMLRTLAYYKTLVLVGFGAGLQDPNFSALRQWMRSVLASSEYRHFRLVRNEERSDALNEHPLEERIIPITYGSSFEDLAPFLKALAPRAIAERGAPQESPPAIVKVRRLSHDLLELVVPTTSNDASVEVNGRLAQVIARETDVLHVRIPQGLGDQLHVQLANASGPGPPLSVPEHVQQGATSWHKVISPSVELFGDPNGTTRLDVRGIELESLESGRRYRRYFPTAKEYEPGQYVSWDFDLSNVAGEAYVCFGTALRPAWSSAGFFNGERQGSAGLTRLLSVKLRPASGVLTVGERVPLRVIATFGDGYGAWDRDVSEDAAVEITLGAVSVETGPSLLARELGRARVVARYGEETSRAKLSVESRPNGLEFLGGVSRVTALLSSPYGLLIAAQASEVKVLSPEYRLETLVRVNVPPTAASGIDVLAVDTEGNVYMRAVWDRTIYAAQAAHDFSAILPIKLPVDDATPMAISWFGAFGLVIADSRQRLWQWLPGFQEPRYWISVPVAPIGMAWVGNELWILGSASAPGLLRLSPTGELLGDVLEDSGLVPSAFLRRTDDVLISDFSAGAVHSLTPQGSRIVAEGFQSPAALAEWDNGDVLVANFGGDSIARIRC